MIRKAYFNKPNLYYTVNAIQVRAKTVRNSRSGRSDSCRRRILTIFSSISRKLRQVLLERPRLETYYLLS